MKKADLQRLKLILDELEFNHYSDSAPLPSDTLKEVKWGIKMLNG